MLWPTHQFGLCIHIMLCFKVCYTILRVTFIHWLAVKIFKYRLYILGIGITYEEKKLLLVFLVLVSCERWDFKT